MGRSKWLLLLLIPMLFGFDTAGPFRTRGPFKAADFTIGGGSALEGIESACTTSGLYGAGGNCVCSETFNQNAAEPSISGNYDVPISPDSHECWGNRFSGVSLEVESGESVETVDVSSDPAWGDIDFVERQSNMFLWAQAPIAAVTSSTRTYCVKFWRQYETKPWSDDGSCRTKAAQFNFGGTLAWFQAQNQSDGGTCTTTAKPHWFTVNDTNYTTTVRTNECDDEPCKIEVCIDGNVQAGTNLQFRMRLTSFEGVGETSIVTSAGSLTAPGSISNQGFTGGDWWHSSPGTEYMRHGPFSVWAWDTDTDQWPPNTVEIEGP